MIIDNVVYVYRETMPNMQYTAVLLLCTDSIYTVMCILRAHAWNEVKSDYTNYIFCPRISYKHIL